ncbi:MAG: FGGY-family carbohydrate kinase [Deltaproteobacteria bacterium]|nr:FGGY-family carbohydrate kinase [Deltaproteobacteria bacterium]
MGEIVLAIDHGTSGIKAALVSGRGEVLDTAYEKTPIAFLPGGGAEQDPDDWWRALVKASRALLSGGKAQKEEIAAVCVSSTFSTTVAIGADGRHLMPALTWMDSRGARYVRAAMGGFPSVNGYAIANLLRWVPKTAGGPTLSGKDDIAHVLFVKNELPKIYEKTRVFLPSKDYLNLRLCGETCASFDSIQLFWVTDTRDVKNIRYEDGLVRRLGIDREKLPPLRKSTDVLGTLRPDAAEELGLGRGVKVVCGSPDHQAALVGSGAVRDFEAHLYVGTSSWVQCLVPFKKTDVLHSIASLPSAVPGRYQSVNEQDVAGGCLAYFADRFFERGAGPDVYREMDEMAQRAPAGSGGLIFAPWLNGERTPVDDERLGGCLLNLTMKTSRDDMVRAVFEGVAFNTRWSLGYVERFCGRRLDPITIVGGGAKSDIWCRIFADVLGRTIRKTKDPMAANARGAAFIAAVGLGMLRFEDVPSLVDIQRAFEPDPGNRGTYDELFHQFRRIHRANRPIFHALNG